MITMSTLVALSDLHGNVTGGIVSADTFGTEVIPASKRLLAVEFGQKSTILWICTYTLTE